MASSRGTRVVIEVRKRKATDSTRGWPDRMRTLQKSLRGETILISSERRRARPLLSVKLKPDLIYVTFFIQTEFPIPRLQMDTI